MITLDELLKTTKGCNVIKVEPSNNGDRQPYTTIIVFDNGIRLALEDYQGELSWYIENENEMMNEAGV